MTQQDRIRFRCPHCHKGVKVKSKDAGKQVCCPNPECAQPIIVPDAAVAKGGFEQEDTGDQEPESSGWLPVGCLVVLVKLVVLMLIRGCTH